MSEDRDSLERRRQVLKDKMYGTLNEVSRTGYKFYFGLTAEYSKFQEEYETDILRTVSEWTSEIRQIESQLQEYESKERLINQLSKKDI